MFDDIEFQPDVPFSGNIPPPQNNGQISDLEDQVAEFALSNGPMPVEIGTDANGKGIYMDPMEEIPPFVMMVETETEIKPDGTRKIVTRNYSPDAFKEKVRLDADAKFGKHISNAIQLANESDERIEQMKLAQMQQEAVNQQLRNQNIAMQQQLAMTMGALSYYLNNQGQPNGPMLGFDCPVQEPPMRLVGPAPEQQMLPPANPSRIINGEVEEVEYVIKDDDETTPPQPAQVNPQSPDIDFGEIEKYL